MDQSARNSCTKSRNYYDIHHSTETGSSQKTTQQQENMQKPSTNSAPKEWKLNEATVEEAIKYGHFLKRSEEDIAEAINIYKTLGNETFYSPEEEDPTDQQEQPQQ